MCAILNVLALVFLTFATLGSTTDLDDDRGLLTERDLRRDLFANYDKLVRPVKIPSKPVAFSAGITPIAVKELDEDKQIIVLDTFLMMRWTDDYLQWDPSQYNNITYLVVPPTEIWKPDLMLYTAIDDASYAPRTLTQALLYNNGSVLWVPPFSIKSRCPMTFNRYPKDVIKCNIRFGSWTYSSLLLDIQLYTPMVDTSDFIDNNMLWKMTNMAISREDKYYPCCTESYPLIHFNVTMKRRFRDIKVTE